LAKPAPTVVAEAAQEPSIMDSILDLWPFLAGAALLGAVGVGMSRLRSRKASARGEGDTYGETPSTQSHPMGASTSFGATEADLDAHPAVAPLDPAPASKPLGAPLRHDSGLDPIQDLESQIFSDLSSEHVMAALSHEAAIDRVQTSGHRPLESLEQKIEPPSLGDPFAPMDMDFEVPGLDAISDEPSTVPSRLAELDEAPMSFELPEDDDAPLDLAGAHFEISEPAPMGAFEVPLPVLPPASAFDEPLSMDYAEAPLAADPFTQAINVAKGTQARSVGLDAGVGLALSENLGDVPGLLQLELACLYAQSSEWTDARATLKEIISDDDMAPAHAEARRLLALIP
jgi:hypothetical protein